MLPVRIFTLSLVFENTTQKKSPYTGGLSILLNPTNYL